MCVLMTHGLERTRKMWQFKSFPWLKGRVGGGGGGMRSRERKWWVSKPTSGDQHNFPERKFLMLSQYPASRIWIYWFTGILLSFFSKSSMWTEIGFLPKMSQILHLLVIILALLFDKIKWIFTSLFFFFRLSNTAS